MIISHFNFNDPRVVFAQYPSWTTTQPQKGESRLFVGQTVPLGYLYLTSTYWIPEGTSKWYTDGQLVKVRRRSNGYVYFDEPIARTFHAPGILYQVPVETGRILENGKNTLSISFLAESEIRNWEISDDWVGPKAVDVQACARLQIKNLKIGRPLAASSYGLGLQQSTRIDVVNLHTTGTRHPIISWGLGGGYIKNVIHSEPAHDFDFGHGFTEDVVYENCDGGDRNAALGNRWDASCNITITQQKNTRDLLVYSGSLAEINQSSFKLLRLYRNLKKGIRVISDWTSFTGHQIEGSEDVPVELLLR